MHTYAVSLPGDMVLAPDFKDAFRTSAIRKIEYSDGLLPDQEKSAQIAAKLEECVKEGLLQVSSLHIPFMPVELWECTSADESLRRQAIENVREYMLRFKNLSIPNVTIHCGVERPKMENRPGQLAQMVRSCQELLPTLEELGASLNLELLPRFCIGNHEDELLTMVEQLPEEHFNICFDVNHLMDRWQEIPAVIRKCANRIRSFHLSDYDGVDECHWQVGHGIIRWPEVITEINALSKDVLIIVEVVPMVIRGCAKRELTTALRLRSAEMDCVSLEYAQELQARWSKMPW